MTFEPFTDAVGNIIRIHREMVALGAEVFAKELNVVAALEAAFPGHRQNAIAIAYELQAGSYTAGRDRPVAQACREECHEIISEDVMPLLRLRSANNISMLDAGIGEGTSWFRFDFAFHDVASLHGVDISLRRLFYLRENISISESTKVSAVCADMCALPYDDRSFDLVVTMHAIEPNAGSAAAIVRRLAEISANVLLLFEPDFLSAGTEMRARMRSFGYAEDIFSAARDLSEFEIVFEKRLTSSVNPLNGTSVICLQRRQPSRGILRWRSPAGAPHLEAREGYFSEVGAEAAALFPVIDGIACLRCADAILRVGG